MNMYKKILLALTFIALVFFATTLKFDVSFKNSNVSFGATNAIPTPIAFFETSLASGITSSATSMTLVSATDKDGNSLSGTYAFIIDEGTVNEEQVNADCTGTACTNMSRGLSVVTGTTSISALQHEHRRGASVKITDSPQLLILHRIVNGISTFPNILSYTSAPTFTSGNQIITKTYADNLSFAGAPDSSYTVKGISERATSSEISAGTATGSTTAPLYINPADLLASIYGVQLPSAGEKQGLAGTSGTAISSSNKFVDNSDTSATASGSKVIRWSSGVYPAGDGSAITGAGSVSNFGDGSDGTVDVNSGSFTSGSIITSNALTRDVYFNNLTLSGGNLNANGYKIYVKGTLTINSTYKITNNGGNGGNGANGGAAQNPAPTGAAGGTAGAIAASGTVGTGLAGKAGGAGGDGTNTTPGGTGVSGTAGSNITRSISKVSGVAGVAGGVGGLGAAAAGTGGAAGTSTNASSFPVTPAIATLMMESTTDGTVAWYKTSASSGSSGGGGGGGGNGVSPFYGGAGGGGGGSGASGGIVVIFAKTIVNNGTIQAIGGNGGTGGNGGAGNSNQGGGGGGGGGSGGSGGVVVLFYATTSGSGTVSVAGGTGSAGGTGGTAAAGSGSSGSTGNNGTTGTIYQIQI